MTEPVLDLSDIHLRIDDAKILRGINWRVMPGEHWIILGPNGSGKTTLIRIASMWAHPSAGRVRVLGETLGQTDVRRHRARIGFASAAMADLLRPHLTVEDVVMTAKNAALEPWWHEYDQADQAQAHSALLRVGCSDLAERRFGSLSSGERQRVLLARALAIDPGLIVLDEPNAALDLGGREQLVTTLAELAQHPDTPPIVLVTHHVEEIPDGFTHALLLSEGCVLAKGPLNGVLTSEQLSECFGLTLSLERQKGRWTARAV